MFRRALLFLLLAVAAATSLTAQGTDFKVVVNDNNPTASLPASEVAKLFLKQATSWSHGGRVKPVDQTESSPARIRFSDEILHRSVAAVESYWQQQIYSGRGVPPVKVGSDAEVVAYVEANTTAIGYVSASASTAGVKVVEIDG